MENDPLNFLLLLYLSRYMLYQGDEIKNLIPQREPIIMVDRFFKVEGEVAETGLTITEKNFFVEEDGKIAESGLIEHIAQSASAFAGHKAIAEGLPAPIGYIGEVKKFRCYMRPSVGDELHTTIEMGAEVNGVSLLTGKTMIGDIVAVETQMKIFVE